MKRPPVMDVQLFHGEKKPLVGVSGGVDSMVLLQLLVSSGFQPHVAHVNYGLRGAESDADQRIVEETCSRLNVRLYVLKADETPRRGESTQVWARRLRYSWFEELARAAGTQIVATAHHQDDQAETMLINLMRGTGAAGLVGMRRSRTFGKDSKLLLVRPLLETSRTEIEGWALREGILWREDQSNQDPAYLRTRARTLLGTGALDHLFPAEKNTVPADGGVTAAEKVPLMRRLAFLGLRVQQLLHDELPRALPEPLQHTLTRGARRRHTLAQEDGRHPLATGAGQDARPKGTSLHIAALRSLPPAVRGWVILETLASCAPGFPRRRSTVEAVEQLMDAQTGSRLVRHEGEIFRDRDVLKVQQREEPLPEIKLGIGDIVDLPDGRFASKRAPVPVPIPRQDPHSEWVDADRLSERWTLRPWKPGDRFVPLGATGSKKVKDLLTDLRVPSSRKPEVRVLVSDGDIVWVVGYRLAERFKLTGTSVSAAQLTWNPESGPSENS